MRKLQGELIKAGLASEPIPSSTANVIPGEGLAEMRETLMEKVLCFYRKPGGRMAYHERASRAKILEVKKIMAGVDKTKNSYQLLECLSLHPRVTAMELTKLFNEGRTEGKIGRRSVDSYLAQYFNAAIATKQREGASYYFWYKKENPLDVAYAKFQEVSLAAKQRSAAHARKIRGQQVRGKAPRIPRGGLPIEGVQKLIVEVIGKVEFVFRLG